MVSCGLTIWGRSILCKRAVRGRRIRRASSIRSRSGLRVLGFGLGSSTSPRKLTSLISQAFANPSETCRRPAHLATIGGVHAEAKRPWNCRNVPNAPRTTLLAHSNSINQSGFVLFLEHSSGCCPEAVENLAAALVSFFFGCRGLWLRHAVPNNVLVQLPSCNRAHVHVLFHWIAHVFFGP